MRVLPDDQPWVFDLISPDDAVRAAARRRNQAVIAGASEALRRYNKVWTRPDSVPLAHAFVRETERTLKGLVSAFCSAEDPQVRARYAPYAVLYLQWEERYPAELAESWMWSIWTAKEVVLRNLHRQGVPPELGPEIADLIVAALHRPYRCKDWRYASLLHQVAPVERIVTIDDDRARFALHVVRNPAVNVTRATYPRWLAAQPAR